MRYHRQRSNASSSWEPNPRYATCQRLCAGIDGFKSIDFNCLLFFHTNIGLKWDILFKDMTFDDWQAGVACKTSGSWNLHTVLPENMDFFILLSSASGLAGLRGQANYNAGNTYEDPFARYRVSYCGAKTISLNLGAMIDDGILANNPNTMQRS